MSEDLEKPYQIQYLENELKEKNKEIERLKDVYEKNLQLVDKLYLKDKEIERLNNIIENLTTMTVNGDRTQIKNTAQYKLEQAEERIKKAIEYIESLIVRDNETKEILSGIHKNSVDTLLDILKGDDKE